MKKTFLFIIVSGLVALGQNILNADVKMPNLLSDNMVLQQQRPIPIWGWAAPGEKVTVSFKGHTLSAVAAQDGKWKVVFPPMKADKTPADMEIVSTSGTKVISNVLIGEVWVCSGQSNMEFSLRGVRIAADTIKTANYPLLRTYNIYQVLAGYPEENANGKWFECSPATASSFSAVGFYFCRELMEKLDVPVGLINSSVGCTAIEAWISEDGFRQVPALKANVEKIENANMKYENRLEEYLPKLEAWLAAVKKDKNARFPGGFPKHLLASGREDGCFSGMETGHFNAMIAPLTQYAIRGVIWYQGETNFADGIFYASKMNALIGGWRKAWGYDFPFYFVQIAPFQYYTNLPNLWLGQYIAANEIKNCDMISTVDTVDDLMECHPQKKEPVGKRLAMLALSDTYGIKNLSAESPSFQALKIEGAKIRVSFRNLGDEGLASSDGKALTWFEIAGKDGVFHKADATIDGKTVIVSSGEVKNPAAVRFAWNQLARPNLCDKKTLLPVFPFHSQLFCQYKLCPQKSDR